MSQSPCYDRMLIESCSSSAVCHLLLTVCVVKQCNQPYCCDRYGQKEVAHCWRRAIFKMTLCYCNNKMTVLWHWVSFWKLLFFRSLPSCFDSLFGYTVQPTKLLRRGKLCSSSSVSHHATILSWVGGRLTKESTFHYFSNSDIITGRWTTVWKRGLLNFRRCLNKVAYTFHCAMLLNKVAG